MAHSLDTGRIGAAGSLDETLATLDPAEIEQVTRFVEAWERSGHLNPITAGEWRSRLARWREFHRIGSEHPASA